MAFSSTPPPHPLTISLIERLGASTDARVLDFGTGKSRNATALRAAGLHVIAIDDATAADEALSWRAELARLGRPLDAALSTHALLHGTLDSNAIRIDALVESLTPGGFFFATFASVRDARYGTGKRVGNQAFAPTDGDECGVAHVYYNEAELRALLNSCVSIESLEEHDVDAVAGTWAHPTTPLRGAVHWFALTRVRS